MQKGRVDLSRQILESVDGGIFALDRDWRFVYLNETAAEKLGKVYQDVLGKSILKEGPELLGTPFEEACRAVMEGGEGRKIETKAIYSNMWVEIDVQPIPNGITVHWRDVTAKRHAVMALEKSEAKYRGLFENMHESVSVFRYVLDESGEIVDWEWIDANAEIEMALGRRKCGLIGMRVSQLYWEGNIPDALMSAVREIRRTGSPVSIESYYDPLMDGYFHVALLPLSQDSFHAMSLDITGLKNAQTRAEEDRARLQAILDNTPVAVGITDSIGGMVMDNGVIEKIFCGGTTLRCVLDYSNYKAWWPESGEKVLPEHWPAARALKGETSTEALEIEKFDGTRGALMVSASPILDKGGNVTGTIWTAQDISEMKRAEEELKRSNADLQQFAYVASHDLQEPLRAVMGQLGLLMKRHGDRLDPDVVGYVNTAIEGAKRMRMLIDDLLTYSRIESDQSSRTMVDLNEVASNAVNGLQMAIEEAGACVEIEALPTVHADGAQMLQVFQNLIGNAIKFRGPAPPHILISARSRRGEWIISVKDNGIGIDPKHQDYLFNMFHRLHARDEYEGTGIGLALVKKIVERHGGHIWFDGEPGKGTTFYFTLRGMA